LQKNRVAIVTGGASGIGFAIAKKLVMNDIKVILDRTRQIDDLNWPVRRLVFFLISLAVTCLTCTNCPSVVKKIWENNGKIDILVNNAGMHLKKPMDEVTDEDFQKVILTNETAMFSLTREVARMMQQQHSGVVLNISSMASQYGLPNVIAYTASKSAVEGMTRAMAVELAQYGIRVNCIAPGFIKTNMSTHGAGKGS
jgi:NAD(P)-dependent dehydrogenase (short-subunit alcohol dehydrogenase family)